MSKKRKYRRKKSRGRGLLGSDWPKIYRNLQPYLRNKKQRGGSWGSIFNWAIKKVANPNNALNRFVNNQDGAIKFLKKLV